MNFLQFIVIFVAKILIFIGDVVLFILGFSRKIIERFFQFFVGIKNIDFNAFYRIKRLLNKLLLHRTIEKEIINFEKSKEKLFLKRPSLPALNIHQRLSKPNSPKLNLPKFSIPKIYFPNFNFPKLKIPTIKIPDISTIPSFIDPALPKSPTLHLRHKKRGRKRILPVLVPTSMKFKYLFSGITLSLIFFFLPAVFVIFAQNLPNPRELANQEISQSTKIFDRNGILLYQIYANQNRTLVPLNKIPKTLQEATIAIEDKNFYSNSGFDIEGIGRSLIADISGKPLQGGSTITQQLIKARLLSPERSLERKAKEVVLAIWAQKIYTKEEILEMYLNQVPYGGTAWGAESASQTYFNKNVGELTLAESAFLAGLPQAPSIYSPYSEYKDAWKGRQKDVLRQMVVLKFITQKEADNALKQKLTFKPAAQTIKAPHFVMYIKELLIQRYGLAMVERGGLNVVTTLDLKTQDMAQKIISDEVENSGYLNFSNAGALITNPNNGDIYAMIGGKDYFDEKSGNYNVTTALRQPGSTIKVVTYSQALMSGYTPASSIQDTPVAFASAGSEAYKPVNYDGKFRGSISFRHALGNSINIPAVKILNQVGISNMMNLAKKMGITTWGEPSEYGLAITLGAAEVKMTDMATLYGSLANEGKRVDLNPITKVTNYRGTVLEEKSIKEKRALPENVAYIISNILADNNARALEFGLNSPLNIPGRTVSVKTGTTDNKRDNWTIGYTPNLLTAVWVGNNDNSPMNPALASGITGAAPIWNKIMGNLLKNQNPKDEIYAVPQDLIIKSCNGKNEYFVKGTEGRANCRPLSINDRNPIRTY